MARIALLGGNFNPVHTGHLILAQIVLEKCSLDKIIFIPSYLPPLKKIDSLASPKDRLNMIRLAIKNNNNFEYSDVELKRKGISYTIDTLEYFRSIISPKDIIYFIIGEDNLKNFHKWKSPENILELAKIICVNRGGYSNKLPARLLGSKLTICNIPNIEISSSEIRKRIKAGRSVKNFLPEQVEKYIIKEKIYM